VLSIWYRVKQASNSHIIYIPRPDATQEAELNALASVYRFVLNCRAKKNAAGVTSTNGTSVRHTEGVGDVERQPD
jgi:hypothetical protein